MRKRQIKIGGMKKPVSGLSGNTLIGKKYLGTHAKRFERFTKEMGLVSTRHGYMIQSSGKIKRFNTFTEITYDKHPRNKEIIPFWSTSAQLKQIEAQNGSGLQGTKRTPKKFTENYESRFVKFARELGKLSTKHGIALQSVGGIIDMDTYTVITYDEDHTSGDLNPKWQ